LKEKIEPIDFEKIEKEKMEPTTGFMAVFKNFKYTHELESKLSLIKNLSTTLKPTWEGLYSNPKLQVTHFYRYDPLLVGVNATLDKDAKFYYRYLEFMLGGMITDNQMVYLTQ
jgi:hypothetical protein